MSNFISIPVDSSDNCIINSNKIVTCIRISSTETILVVDGGTASNTATDQLTVTHNADSATDSVSKSIMETVILSYFNNKTGVVKVVSPPQTITAIGFG
jgi:hypothetical protein